MLLLSVVSTKQPRVSPDPSRLPDFIFYLAGITWRAPFCDAQFPILIRHLIHWRRCPVESISCAMAFQANSSKQNPEFSRNFRGSSRSKIRQNLRGWRIVYFPLKTGALFLCHTTRATLLLPLLGKGRRRLSSNSETSRHNSESEQPSMKRRGLKLHSKVRERRELYSLLKLLRKYLVARGKKGNGDDSYNLGQPEKTDSFDQPERRNPLDEGQNFNFFKSGNLGTKETSNVLCRSSVPSVKFQPVFLDEEDCSRSRPILKAQEKITGAFSEPKLDPEPELELEFKPQHQAKPEPNCEIVTEIESFDDASEMRFDLSDMFDAEEADEGTQNDDLSFMKLSELRNLAKSGGIKGYSKLKKSELLELFECA